MDTEKLNDDDLLRLYAAGKLSWRKLRERESLSWYGDVLLGLGRLGLKYPSIAHEPKDEKTTKGLQDLETLMRAKQDREKGMKP